MIAQTNDLKHETQRNIKRTAKIIYLLKLNGITQQQVADELGIKKQTVNRVISGKARSNRVNTWLKENLGI